MLAVVAPGQGSQKPGMLAPWLETDGAAATLDRFSAAAGLDLTRLGTSASADEIKDTAVTQPLVVAAALLAATALDLPASAVTAGHSVGELAAAALAGVLTDDDAVRLAGIRGAAMGRACAVTPTSMAAVLGGTADDVLAALAGLDLVGANVNGAGQIVAAGAEPAIRRLAAEPPAGTRVIPLQVAGAFHTAFMAPAQDELRDRVADIPVSDARRPLLTNSDGSVVEGAGSGSRYLRLLVDQVTRPVRWDRCMATFRGLGVTGVLELPPAGTLVGLVKRDLKGVATLALRTPDDLDAAAAFVREHEGVPA
ncbi:ACP S-malonyltransferase [Nakamurella endophytica]|uniref:[acyl-carrier-protein] S-malonyltransferase n=1 Tax=Nakamurella endophytica TaxID=1748367 RepID=A0A917WIK6_9ACTN|nr:ACP S-malonyltransferase [Nakamurella endophytica]GGM06134.1 ACP S-malonyltransferase [Nakamurella endophytica]